MDRIVGNLPTHDGGALFVLKLRRALAKAYAELVGSLKSVARYVKPPEPFAMVVRLER